MFLYQREPQDEGVHCKKFLRVENPIFLPYVIRLLILEFVDMERFCTLQFAPGCPILDYNMQETSVDKWTKLLFGYFQSDPTKTIYQIFPRICVVSVGETTRRLCDYVPRSTKALFIVGCFSGKQLEGLTRNLKSLAVGASYCDTESGVKSLEKLVSTLTKIDCLAITSLSLPEKFVKVVKKLKKIRLLQFMNCKIDNLRVKTLLKSIPKSLERLDLSYNDISADGLYDILRNPQLKVLNVRNNSFLHFYLPSAIRTSVTSLDISSCHVQEDLIAKLIEFDFLSTLVCQEMLPTDRKWKHPVDKKNFLLENLDVSWSDLSQNFIKAVTSSCVNIKLFSANGCSLNDKDIKQFSKCAATLNSLSLVSNDGITEVGARTIVQEMRIHRLFLTTTDLIFREICESRVLNVFKITGVLTECGLESLRDNFSIEELGIYCQFFDYSLVNWIKEECNVKEIDFDFLSFFENKDEYEVFQ